MVSHYDTEMTRLSLNRSIREKLYARNPYFSAVSPVNDGDDYDMQAKVIHSNTNQGSNLTRL